MVKRTGPTNKELKETILALKRTKKTVWKRVAEMLEKPSRQRRTLNIRDIDKNAKKGDTIIVPGKVLSEGLPSKKFSVSAWQFSSLAEEKLKKANCDVLSIHEIIKKNPDGKKVRIFG